MKNYHGERTEEGTRVWWVDDTDGSTGVLRHHVLHSPDGFEWGYSGSGPADLARSLLWDVLGVAPETAQYQTFKEDTVAGWKTAKWSINAESITRWVESFDARSDGHVLQEQRRGWFEGLRRR